MYRHRPHADGSDIYTALKDGMLRVVFRLSGGLVVHSSVGAPEQADRESHLAGGFSMVPHGGCDPPALIVGWFDLRHDGGRAMNRVTFLGAIVPVFHLQRGGAIAPPRFL